MPALEAVKNAPLREANTKTRMSPVSDVEPKPEPAPELKQEHDVKLAPVRRSERILRPVVRFDL